MPVNRHDLPPLILEDLQALPPLSEENARLLALYRLAQRLREFWGDSLGETSEIEAAALSVTRRLLVELYEGFLLQIFSPDEANPFVERTPPVLQQDLERALRLLGEIPPARALMFRWFMAGLKNEIQHLLRQELEDRPGLRQRTARWLIPVLSFLTRTALSRPDSPDFRFGVTGLSLLWPPGEPLLPSEFESVLALLDEWTRRSPLFPLEAVTAIGRLLTRARLSASQCFSLARQVQAWGDFDRYPPYQASHTTAEGHSAASLPRPVTRLAEQIGPQQRAHLEEMRRQTIALLLARLAFWEESLFPDFLSAFSALRLRPSWQTDWEVERVLWEALPAVLRHPHRLSGLAEHLKRQNFTRFELPDTQEGLPLVPIALSAEALQALLGQIRTNPATEWPLQVLALVRRLTFSCEARLPNLMQQAETVPVQRALFTLYEALTKRDADLSPEHQAAFVNAALPILFHSGAHLADFPLDWLLSRRALFFHFLRRLNDLAGRFAEAEQEDIGRVSVLLDALVSRDFHLPQLDPALLAACLLLHSADPLQTGQSLGERLHRAIRLLERPVEEEELYRLLTELLPRPVVPAEEGNSAKVRAARAHPLLTRILFTEDLLLSSGMRRGAPFRRALAVSARYFSPARAVLLLSRLFDLAVEMGRAWAESDHFLTELYREANLLVSALLDSLTRLRPFPPEAIPLLETMLLAPAHLPERLFSLELSPAKVQQIALPNLAQTHALPEALPELFDALRRNGLPPEGTPSRRRLVTLCLLHLLFHGVTFNEAQRRILSEIFSQSPDALTQAAALLAWGRGRPVGQDVFQATLDALRPSPLWPVMLRQMGLRRNKAESRASPGGFFLVRGVAVSLLMEWLREEVLPSKWQEQAQRALQQAASAFHRTLEPRLTESTHPLQSATASAARGLWRAIAPSLGLPLTADPDRLVYPAQLAYEGMRLVRLMAPLQKGCF